MLESCFVGTRAQRARLQQRVDVPATTEPLDGAARRWSSDSEIITNREHAAGTNQPAALIEEASGRGNVNEGLNGVRRIGRTEIGRQVRKVALDAGDAIAEAGIV